MASSLASDKPTLPAPGGAPVDPFVASTPKKHHRYSDFDQDLFIAGPASSPRRAKRALESHLAETERRLEEAGKLGTALVSQRKALTEQLSEVEKLQADGDLNPELRQKLVEIEKEYNNLARESARAFLPKQRVPSNEAPGSPFVVEGRSGRRSVSPSKFESQATGSPTKLSVPNRKIRNQPSNRVHDIEFAAEISTSLIAQVRNLQALLAEREEELKDTKADKSRLEIESENFQQRAKTLDESENRYKEENWNLETRLQEFSSQQKEAADREKKLTQSLNVIRAEKVASQRELDEVKVSHARLAEEHSAAVKHHDIELGTVKRNIAIVENERFALQRKIDDLTNQNQELARAFSVQRSKIGEREANTYVSDDDRESAANDLTPEHSPPQSPVKGTPRHVGLEAETIKSSLHHAQRTIQSQRGLLHREKTEKLELRRIIQDLRDDLEKARNESHGSNSARKARKQESKEFKKPPRLLGSFRSSKQEFIHDDPEWEDQQDVSPRASSLPIPAHQKMPQAGDSFEPPSGTDHFDTANEGGESAFETANERGTETEDFQTTNEELSGSDGAETETEMNSHGFGRMRKPPSLLTSMARHSSRHSIRSTASTSADEADYTHMRTPTGTMSSQRSSRFRLSRNMFNRPSRQASEEPPMQSSPASMVSSSGGTPQTGGQSLFAELQDLDGSDDESVGANSPSRNRHRSVTPASAIRERASSSVPPVPRAPMVDCGVMTEPVKIIPALAGLGVSLGDATNDGSQASSPTSPVSVVADGRPMSMVSVIGPSGERTLDEALASSRPMSLGYSDSGAQYDADMEAKLSQFPAPPTVTIPAPPVLSLSDIAAEHVEPKEEPVVLPVPPALSFTPLSIANIEPVAEPAVPPPTLSMAIIVSGNLEPVAEPEIPPPVLSFSNITASNLEPVAEPEIPPPTLSLSVITASNLEPVAEPEVPPPVLSMFIAVSGNLEPVPEPVIPPPALSLSIILNEHVEPVAEPEVPAPELTFMPMVVEHVEPVAEPETPLPELTFSSVQGESVEPVATPDVPLPALTLAKVMSEGIEPVVVAQPKKVMPQLTLSKVTAESIVPVSLPDPKPVVVMPPPPSLLVSKIVSQHIEPVMAVAPKLSMSNLTRVNIEPVAPPKPVLAALPPAPKPKLSMSNIVGEHIAPIAPPEPAPVLAPKLSMSNIVREHVEPIAPPPEPERLVPKLSISTIQREHVEPLALLPPDLAMSNISTQEVEPIAEPEKVIPVPALGLSTIFAEHCEPVQEPEPTPIPIKLSYSDLSTQHVQPVQEPEPVTPALSFSTIATENVKPIQEPTTPPPVLSMSAIAAEGVKPIKPIEKKPVLPTFGFSSIESVETRPMTPRSPRRNGFILPKDATASLGEHQTPPDRMLGALGRNKNRDSPTIIAEDETSGDLPDEADTPESQRPFREISTNTTTRPVKKVAVPTSDQGAQTSLTADAIDAIFSSKLEKKPSLQSFGTPATTGTVRIRRSQESFGSPIRNKGKMIDDGFDSSSLIRPDSSASARTSILDAPPLPPNHRQVIEAARSGSSHGVQTNMPPPLWPASALKMRPNTPKEDRPMTPSGRGSPTPRAARSGVLSGGLDTYSPTKLTAASRKSSMSSFASELDTRFHMRPSEMGMDGFGPNTDPRMIQAITQTMIGEYLWKYTRKTGRGEMSEKRHRRYFWVHPYTKTLYWSDRDPSTGGRSEVKAKSVPIEAVRVVTDDNPMPPGLHRKSLVIISPGRTIKFTCTTGQRHETWFNALSYLLLRTDEAAQIDTDEMAENITREDVDEFNPQVGGRRPNGTRAQQAPSLSSYNSRPSRSESPAVSMAIPTLTPSKSAQRQSAGAGTLRRLRRQISGTFSGRRGRAVSGQDMSIYEASEAHDSAEDVREIIERQDREADRLENVRACCDGKHDVGTLHHTAKKGRYNFHNHHAHSHPGLSTTTPMGSLRSRA